MIVFNPDLYDTLELSVLSTKGIGAGRYAVDECDTGYEASAIPVCIIGHGRAAGALIYGAAPWVTPLPSISVANDHAVHAINQRKGKYLNSRVSWAEFVAEMGIVRGENHVSE